MKRGVLHKINKKSLGKNNKMRNKWAEGMIGWLSFKYQLKNRGLK